jgi:DNA-3-methyladenine glycosylase
MTYKIPIEFYRQKDVLILAKALLGKHLITEIDGKISRGLIVETEAYRGWGDQACHAHAGRRTARTRTMYEPGGIAYVYLCYGIHHLFNIITNEAEHADAVLVRAIEPLEGTAHMLRRRGMETLAPRLGAGPGCVTQALGIDCSHNGLELAGSTVWLEDAGNQYPAEQIAQGPRVGIAYAGEDALLPWRFWLKGNPYVSKARPKY